MLFFVNNVQCIYCSFHLLVFFHKTRMLYFLCNIKCIFCFNFNMFFFHISLHCLRSSNDRLWSLNVLLLFILFIVVIVWCVIEWKRIFVGFPWFVYIHINCLFTCILPQDTYVVFSMQYKMYILFQFQYVFFLFDKESERREIIHILQREIICYSATKRS
jgi:hypothetical protein